MGARPSLELGGRSRIRISVECSSLVSRAAVASVSWKGWDGSLVRVICQLGDLSRCDKCSVYVCVAAGQDRRAATRDQYGFGGQRKAPGQQKSAKDNGVATRL